MKKIRTLMALAAMAGGIMSPAVFAEDEDFFINLDQDYSEVTADEGTASSSSSSNIKQGIWIETTGTGTSLVRDVATGKISGYDFDNAHLESNANWWFWGDITPTFHLDAEISVWDFDKTLYQANSSYNNVASVTWGDGLQSLASMPFSFLYNGNDDGVGSFNKFGFNITTPVFNTKIGYGKLKYNGMSEYTGIYTVIDRWLDVGKGFTEISNGSAWQHIGSVDLNTVAALSMMHGTYGTYGFVDLKYDDKVQGALTWGSYTNKSALFYYDKYNINSASAYLAVTPIDPLKIEAHYIYSFGTEVVEGLDSMAMAGRIGYEGNVVSVREKFSYAGSQVKTGWGSDGQSYDNINADTYTNQMDLSIAPVSWLNVSFDEGFTFNDIDDVKDSKWVFRNEPMVDLDLSPLTGLGIEAGLYGVINVDKTPSTCTVKDAMAYFEEGGIEVTLDEVIPAIKKVTADYAIDMPWVSSDDSYLKNNMIYHSIMVNADITEKINAHFGSVIRTAAEGVDTSTLIPASFAGGVCFSALPMPGSPMLWVHFTYAMDPYDENNYTLYRADNYLNKPVHRTYLLDDLDATKTSSIGLGFIWNL